MGTVNPVSSIATCPSTIDGWTDLTQLPPVQAFREILFSELRGRGGIKVFEDAANEQQQTAQKLANFSQYLEKSAQRLQVGLPVGALCRRIVAGNVSYFVQTRRFEFAELILRSAKTGPFEAPEELDMGFSKAIALITDRRHPSAEDITHIAEMGKTPPAQIEKDHANDEWSVVNAGLTPELVVLIRYELNDHDNSLFRKAQHGDAYYVTTDVEKLSQIIEMLREVTRDLTVVGQGAAASFVGGVVNQLDAVRLYQYSTQPFYRKPLSELLPLVGSVLAGGLAAGYLFHAGGDLWMATKRGVAKLFDKNDRNPPSAGAGGAGIGSDVGVTRLRPVSAPSDADEFVSLDDRVDAGESADFQIDPTRAYDRLQHFHINGAAVAAVAVVGGVALLVPVTIPYLTAASPEAISLATGIGVWAASH